MKIEVSSTSPKTGVAHEYGAVTPLRQRMIEDMNARKLGAHSQRSHISSCKRFAGFLKRSPDTATPDDVRRFQLHLAETGMSICNRNRIMTGVKFLFRVTLRRPDLAAEIYHLREPQKIYDLLFKASAETMIAIAADPRHLGARIGITAVLHTWGSAMTHHPHVHMIVPGGGITADGSRWVSCRPNFFLSVRVLARLFRGLFLAKLRAAHQAGRLKFFGRHAHLDDARAFKAYLAPLRNIEWVVYAKRPFGGPQAVIAYLSRYTHRVAISNHRLISADETAVTFKWKDYRIEGPDRYKTMSLDTPEFIRRFLIHVLPKGFHRIRHYGLLASANRAANIAHARKLLAVPSRPKQPETPKAAIDQPRLLPRPCPCCGGRLIVIETFARGCQPKHWPASPKPIRIDTS